MKFKSIKTKITAQFGLILLITCGVIFSAIFVFGKIQGNMQKVADAAPKFGESMQLNQNMELALYHLRGYLISHEDEDIKNAQKYFSLVQENVNALKAMNLNDPTVDRLVAIIGGYASEVMKNDRMRTAIDEKHAAQEAHKKKFVSLVEQIRDGLAAGMTASNYPVYARNIRICSEVIRMEDKHELYKDDAAKLEEVVVSVNNNIDKIKQFARGAGQGETLDKLLKNIEEFAAVSQEYYGMLAEFKESTAKIESLGDEVLELAQKLTGESTGIVMSTLQVVGGSVVYGRIFMMVAILIVIVVSIILIRIMAHNTTTPIEHAVEGISRISDGDLTHKVKVESEDELGNMAEKINYMTDRLQQVVGNIVDGSMNIYQSATEMSRTSQFMNDGANRQAASAAEVRSSVEQMTTSISQNSDNAKTTEKIAQNALLSIRKGSEASNKSVAAMKEIAEKISIVDEIAFQTNILALNAAVEAARAGEHGKGFAVVAAEVRKLAERSAIAAAEIDKVSREGVSISQNAGYLLKDIIPDMEKTTDLVREIAAASSEQSSGIDMINNAVQHLNEITQQYAASAEELASTSQNMAVQSENLKNTVAYFKTE